MKVVVFVGPTLAHHEVAQELDADVRPPAMRGDVFDAALGRPDVIAVIDGYFDRVPSVWHKEFLWALSRGIHVVGAASMGALRASELACHGMLGVGSIYEAYLRGEYADDDEVAVVHGPAEDGYPMLSDAMVNIRATLAFAREQNIVTPEVAAALIQLAKDQFYPERSYAGLLKLARQRGLPNAELCRLGAWLPVNKVDQKRKDALQLLELLAHNPARWAEPLPPTKFVATDAWQVLENEVRARHAVERPVTESCIPNPEHLDYVEELLIDGCYGSDYMAATLRLLVASRVNNGAMSDVLGAVVEEVRRERNLLTPESYGKWLDDQVLSEAEALPFFGREALLRREVAHAEGSREQALCDHLRMTGRFGAVRARAQSKKMRLLEAGLDRATARDAGLSETQLWEWFFTRVLCTKLPPDVRTYAAEQCVDPERLRAAAAREYCFRRLMGTDR